MSRHLDDVVEKYEFNLTRGTTPRARSGSVRQQVEHYRDAQDHNMLIVELTRRVLVSAGLPSFSFPFYYSFSRVIDKSLRSGLSQETLRAEARAQIDLWVLRGLRRDVLRAVCLSVFNLTLDVPPPPV